MLSASIISIFLWKVFVFYSEFNKTARLNTPPTMNSMISELIKYFVEASEINSEKLSELEEQVYLKLVFDSNFNNSNSLLFNIFDFYKNMEFSLSCIFSNTFKPHISFSSIDCFNIKFLERNIVIYQKEILTEKYLPKKKFISSHITLKYILNYIRIYTKFLDRFRNPHQRSLISLVFGEYQYSVLNNNICEKFVKNFFINGETYIFVIKKADKTFDSLIHSFHYAVFDSIIDISMLQTPRDSYRTLRDKLFLYFYKLCIYNQIKVDINFLKKIDKGLLRVLNNYIGIKTNEDPNIIFTPNYIACFKKFDKEPYVFFLEDYMYVKPTCLYSKKEVIYNLDQDKSFVLNAQRVYKFPSEKIQIMFVHFHLSFMEFPNKKILQRFPEAKSFATMCKCIFRSHIFHTKDSIDFGFNRKGECVFMYIDSSDENFSAEDGAVFYSKIEEIMSEIAKLMIFSDR